MGFAGLAAPLLQACGGGDSVAQPPLPTGTYSESAQWMREAILDAIGKSDSAVSVALFAEDSVVWSEAFGYANRETGLRTTVDMRMNIGSVSKTIAALAVMILRDRGKLDLDQPVVELNRNFSMRSPEYARVTVRHLLNHSSGFLGTNYRNLINFVPTWNYWRDTVDVLAQSRLKHEPGDLSVYCNDGFTVLEWLVGSLTSRSYSAFVDAELLKPLGMTSTEFPLQFSPEVTFVHPVYQGQTLPQEFVAAHASGGILSTPADMMKLARLILDRGVFEGRRIVSEGALQDMGVNQAAYTRINPVATSWRWGLGWDCVAQPGLAAAGLLAWKKGGDTAFFHSDFIVLPHARMAAMMTNDSQFSGNRLALLEGMLLRAAKERGLISALPPAMAPVVPPVEVPAPGVSAVTGIYAKEGPPIRVQAESDGTLSLSFWNAKGWATSEQGLRLRTDGWWWADGVTNRSYSFRTVAGHLYLTGRVLAGSRLYWDEGPMAQWLPEARAPLSAAWRSRLNSRWKGENDDPDSYEGKLEPRTGVIGELAERPGYVMWDNAQLLRVINDDEAGVTVEIPALAGRDLVELRMVKEGIEEKLHVGALQFRRDAQETLR